MLFLSLLLMSTSVCAQSTLIVTDPETLRAIEARGYDFASLIDDPVEANHHLDALARRPGFSSIARVLADDIAKQVKGDKQAGTSIAKNAHRVFDVNWLHSSSHWFELVAVVNRTDRKPFHDKACGETRLVYRLTYAKSRLPMTAIIEYLADEGDCVKVKNQWAIGSDKGAALVEKLLSRDGPLAPERVNKNRVHQLAFNVQAVRWPSAVRPDLGGHAEYLLRAFEPADDRWRVKKLENTPELGATQNKAQLLDWIASNLAKINEGTAVLPERFMADKAISVSPKGLARLSNRPFRQLFAPSELQNIVSANTADMLLRRLDDLSCQGCHQSHAVAGFHLLGEDGPRTIPGNALAVAFSPHMAADLKRRALGDFKRPVASRIDGGYGDACGLTAEYVGWKCQPGLQCLDDADGLVGSCQPATADVGDACEPARVTLSKDAHADRAAKARERECPSDGVCEATNVGFPGGMCAVSCDAKAPATCGAIALLREFNDCLAENQPFSECLRDNVRPAGLRACSQDQACREDYLCARTASGQGACIPPYFLFQMRVDGHTFGSRKAVARER